MGCVSASDYEPCEFEPGCGLRTLWARARAALLGVLDETTVADLCSPAEGQRAVGLKTVPRR
jgi:DNA-binding IscR family transcriptional regulator